jgi:hypothetical protein
MTKTNAKHGDRRPEPLNQLHRDPGIFRTTRSWRDHDVIGMHRSDLVERDFVIAPDDRRCAKLAEILGEVEGERVVVIEEQQQVRAPPRPS